MDKQDEIISLLYICTALLLNIFVFLIVAIIMMALKGYGNYGALAVLIAVVVLVPLLNGFANFLNKSLVSAPSKH